MINRLSMDWTLLPHLFLFYHQIDQELKNPLGGYDTR